MFKSSAKKVEFTPEQKPRFIRRSAFSLGKIFRRRRLKNVYRFESGQIAMF